jgi:pimeloyl-ACP methyl ester carboxylesterase
MVEEWLTVGRHRIYCKRSTDLGEEPIIFVHGIGVSHQYFLPLVQRLKSNQSWILFDLPGFGSSSTPTRQPDINEYAAITNDLLKKVNAKNVTVVGHSMGCQIAATLAKNHPGTVTRVILIGPTVDSRKRSAMHHFYLLMRNGSRENIKLNLLIIKDYIRCGPRSYFKTLNVMLADRIESSIKCVNQTIIYIRGARDPIVQSDWMQILASKSERSEIHEIARARHGVHYSHPAETAKIIIKAIAE